MKNILRGLCLTILFNFIIIDTQFAQCPMCKIAAESNLKSGGNAGRGLNAGILYLFATPYLLVGGIAYIWYRNRKRRDEMEMEEELSSI
jgi:hypothetical protein